MNEQTPAPGNDPFARLKTLLRADMYEELVLSETPIAEWQAALLCDLLESKGSRVSVVLTPRRSTGSPRR